ncbi:Mechanosensory protein 2 [Paragonimus heterotremus]|uniref:Mechanosensory protein 2 n=1 Tax=Paragonimus heterotremus TaxID=100268 RepID=A0A8J4SV67_9TREM|nr:Mechanosensory protein 2 [Paragonimus heterotremus]
MDRILAQNGQPKNPAGVYGTSEQDSTVSGHVLHSGSIVNSNNDSGTDAELVKVDAKPRVSFDDDSNTLIDSDPQNYEDVVTLHVPTKDNLWLSCKQSKRPFKWLRGKRKSKQSLDEYEATDLEETNLTNGNHVQSAYENEPEALDNIAQSKPSEMWNERNGHKMEGLQDTESPQQSLNEGDENRMTWTTNFLAALSIFLIVITFPFSLIYCIRIVAEYERAVVLRMGNLIPKGRGTKGPGLFFILPCIDSVRKVDLRTVTFAIPPQELLTRDSVTVSVDAVVYYRVLNPVASVLNIEDATRSTRLLAQTTIRNVLGTKDLAQILMDRDEISTAMQSSLDTTTDAWGVKVERVEIKDVRLPIQLQRVMAAEAEAAREARAKVIAATGEKDAAHSLKKAARVIATSPMAFQLRYLQTLCAISAEKNSTIFFPVPIDIMQHLGDFNRSSGGINSTCQMWTNSEHCPEQTNNPESEQRGMRSQSETCWNTEDIDASSDTV